MSGVTKAVVEEKIVAALKSILAPDFNFDTAVENLSDEKEVDEVSVASGGNGDKEPQPGAAVSNTVDAGEVAAKAAGGDGGAEGPAAGFEASEAAGGDGDKETQAGDATAEAADGDGDDVDAGEIRGEHGIMNFQKDL